MWLTLVDVERKHNHLLELLRLDQPQTCTGGPEHNSWYGSGQVNALRAVTHDMGG
jgi:hypothetical protein